MTWIAHTELKEVNKCHFLTTKGPENSSIKLLTIVSYNSCRLDRKHDCITVLETTQVEFPGLLAVWPYPVM